MEFYVAIFTVASIIGYVLETLWCFFTYGVFESRQGMVFGPFSQVYGLGALILTLCLSHVKSPWKIFAASAVIGGVYEYLCSWIQEKMFGTVSWDYSGTFLSIGGRTSLVFCVFWGILGLVLIKVINPPLLRLTDKIHPRSGAVVSAIMAAFFILNLQLSYMAVRRQSARRLDKSPKNKIESWLDTRFDDDALYAIYPNMRVVRAESKENGRGML